MNTITLSKKALLDIFKLVRATIQRKTIIPALAGVYIEICGNLIRFRATDLESFLTLSLIGTASACTTTESWRIVVPFTALHEVIRSSGVGDIIFDLDTTDGALVVSSAQAGRVTLTALAPV